MKQPNAKPLPTVVRGADKTLMLVFGALFIAGTVGTLLAMLAQLVLDVTWENSTRVLLVCFGAPAVVFVAWALKLEVTAWRLRRNQTPPGN